MTSFVNNDVASGNIIYAADHNEQGALLASVLNGNLDSTNLADGAITKVKIGSSAIDSTKVDWSTTGGVWWEELGRNVLASSADTITISSFTARKYLKIIINVLATGGTIDNFVRFNNDSGNNYARRLSTNGAADSAVGSGSTLITFGNSASSSFMEIDVINIATQEKVATYNAVLAGTAGAANVPSRITGVGKWANTSNQITRIDVINNSGTGDFAIGSEVIVLGHD